MVGTRTFIVGISLLFLVHCRERAEELPSPPIEPAPAPIESATPKKPPGPPFQPLELGQATELPVREGQRSPGTSIEVRLLPERRPGMLLDTQNLKNRVPLNRGLRGALVGTPGRVKFVPHHATDVSGLGTAPFFLVGSITGLWLHEWRSIARRARLTGIGIRAVAATPDGSLVAYATDKGAVEIIEWPSLRLVSQRNQWAKRLHWSTDGRWLGIATGYDDAVLFDAKARRFFVVNTQDDTHDVAPLPGDKGVAIVANDSNAMQLFDIPRRKMLAQGEMTGRDLVSAAYDPERGEIIVGGNENTIQWYDEKNLEKPRIQGRYEADIYGLLCCRKGRLLVAFDERALALMSPNSFIEEIVGPLDGWSGTYSGRAAFLGDERVVAQLGGEVFVWDPGVSFAQAIEYGRLFQGAADEPVVSVTADELVGMAIRDNGTTIVRVRKGAPTFDIEADAIGSTDAIADYVSIAVAPDGMRLLQAIDDRTSPRQRIEFALLPPGGVVSEWVGGPAECAKRAKRVVRGRDETHWVMQARDGSSCEIAREPLSVQAIESKGNGKPGGRR